MIPRGSEAAGRLAVLVDFDGTAAAGDVGVALLEKFARDDSWKVIDNDYESGRLGSRAAYRILSGLLEGTPEDWLRFAGGFRLDAGLPALAYLARSRGWLLEVLSDGLGYYIRALLGRAGLDLPIRTNELLAAEGGVNRIVTPHLNPRCGRCGTCKAERVESLSSEGWRVVYVGDGYSDLCAAPRADRLFAKSVLARHCRERGIPHETFETLDDVARALESEAFRN